MGVHVTKTGTVSCKAFYDLDFDLWQFHRYDEYFTATSAFTLHPAGTYTGPASIKEYVKFASDESPFVDSFRVLPGGLALLKRMTPEGTCLFMVMGHRRYELSAKHAGGEAVHVATLATVTYTPPVHRINDIALYYETPFMQFVFDCIRTRKSGGICVRFALQPLPARRSEHGSTTACLRTPRASQASKRSPPLTTGHAWSLRDRREAASMAIARAVACCTASSRRSTPITAPTSHSSR